MMYMLRIDQILTGDFLIHIPERKRDVANCDRVASTDQTESKQHPFSMPFMSSFDVCFPSSIVYTTSLVTL